MTHFKLPFLSKNTKFTQTLIINSLIVWQCSEIVTNIRQYYRILSHQTLVACMSVSSLLQYIVYLQFVFCFFLILDEEVDRVNPLCTTSKFSWKVYIGTVLFKPWIFRQWLCGCGGYERVCTLCNLFGNHFLEQHSSHIYIKGSLEYSGLSRNYSNATGSGSVIERFQIQLQNDCKRSINHRYVYKPKAWIHYHSLIQKLRFLQWQKMLPWQWDFKDMKILVFYMYLQHMNRISMWWSGNDWLR